MPVSEADSLGRTTSVTILNPSIEEAEPVELRVKNPCEKKAVWYELDGAAVDLPAWLDGEFIKVRLPKLAAWGVDTVFLV